MAFQEVKSKSRNVRKATEMQMGEVITAYVVGFEPSASVEGQLNMLLQNEDGSTFVLYPAGNIRFRISDGDIKEGLLTQITRIADKVVKGGKKSTQFSIQQDPEKSIPTAGSGLQSLSNNVAALSAKASISEQASRLSASIGKRG
jgi:hypothetical protein